jgi:phage/conjugal plasmid C-4 type zinc finger TraR family protein
MFADPLDVADANTTKQLETTLENRVVYTGISNEFCEDCDDEIPLARRLAGVDAKKCVHCQTKAERK